MTTLKVIKLDKDLNGIAQIDGGKLIQIPFTKINDEVWVEEIDFTKSTPLATKYRVESINNHQKPICEYFYKCGGCKLQHLSENEYVQAKLNSIYDVFNKFNIAYNESIDFIHNYNNPSNQRKRVQFSVGNNVMGFHSYKQNHIIDINQCPLLSVLINDSLPILKEIILKHNNILKISKVHVSQINNQLDIILDSNIKINGNIVQMFAPLFALDYVARIYLKNNKQQYQPIIIKNEIYLSYGKFKVYYHCESFLQAQESAENYIIDFVKKHLHKANNILDLFCGYGSYAFNLISVNNNQKIYCIDVSQNAINSIAKSNVPNIRVRCANIFTNPLMVDDINPYDGIILNPPRAGAYGQIKEIAKGKVKDIIMIYCSHSSLGRDLQILINSGKYKINNMIVVDQFLFTKHVEIIVHLQYIGS